MAIACSAVPVSTSETTGASAKAPSMLSDRFIRASPVGHPAPGLQRRPVQQASIRALALIRPDFTALSVSQKCAKWMGFHKADLIKDTKSDTSHLHKTPRRRNGMTDGGKFFPGNRFGGVRTRHYLVSTALFGGFGIPRSGSERY